MRIRKNSNQGGVERDLRDARPRLPGDLADSLSAAAGTPRHGSSRRTGAARLAVLGIAVVAVAAVGGIGFAASTAFQSAKVTVQKVGASSAKAISVKQATAVRNAAADQYGDDSNIVDKKGKAPKAGASTSNATKQLPGDTVVLVSGKFSTDSSGKLSVIVNGADGKPVPISLSRSSVDGDVAGSGTSLELMYEIVTPRSGLLTIAIPVKELVANEKLVVVTKFTDTEGLTSPVRTSKATAPKVLAPPTAATPTDFSVPVTSFDGGDKTALYLSLWKDGTASVTVNAFEAGARSITLTWNGKTDTGTNTAAVTIKLTTKVSKANTKATKGVNSAFKKAVNAELNLDALFAKADVSGKTLTPKSVKPTVGVYVN